MNQILDRHGILRDLTNDCHFRVLLALALEETTDSTHRVLELGIASRSTPYLHDYCEPERRQLVSVEESIRTAAPFLGLRSTLHELRVTSWGTAAIEFGLWSVALVLNAPGERRRVDVARLASQAEIIVIHDTEPAADYGYRLSEVWPMFRSRVDIKTDGAWSTAVSNTHDLSRWRGRRFGPFVVSGGDDDVRGDAHSDHMKRLIAGEVACE